MKFKRQKQGKTDYKKRFALLKSGKPRLVVRKSLNNVRVQIVKYRPEGDEVVFTADLGSIKKHGWKAGANIPAAYLIGFLAGKLALKAKVKEAILDMGRHRATKGGKIFAALKGAIDAGLIVPHDESVFPSKERLEGQHIAGYKAPEPVFNSYKQRKLDPTRVPEHFKKVLESIRGGK